MANDLVTIDHIASRAMANLYSRMVMAGLVHRDYSQEFVPGRGRTISVRRPTKFSSNLFDRATGVITQNADEDTFDVQLDKLRDVTFAVTAEEWTMDITEFDERFIDPACEAIAQDIDLDIIAAARAGLPGVVGTAAYAQEDTNVPTGLYNWADSRVLIQAGELLNKNKVPTDMRRVVVGPSTEARWTAERTWRQTDKRGSTEGLREASMGDRVSGFTPYMTQNIAQPANNPATGQPTTEVNLAFHRDAISLVTRPLALPRGANSARVIDYEGFGLRIVTGYDQKYKVDTISIDTLYGVKVINPERGVKIMGPVAA